MFSLRSLSKGDIPKLLHLILGAGCLNTQGKRREEKRREEKRREEKRREEKRMRRAVGHVYLDMNASSTRLGFPFLAKMLFRTSHLRSSS
jgi:hypothetical protein